MLSLQQPATKQAATRSAGEEKTEESVDAIQSMAVREKLKELETEIDKFRTENAALAKMRSEREEVRDAKKSCIAVCRGLGEAVK